MNRKRLRDSSTPPGLTDHAKKGPSLSNLGSAPLLSPGGLAPRNGAYYRSSWGACAAPGFCSHGAPQPVTAAAQPERIASIPPGPPPAWSLRWRMRNRHPLRHGRCSVPPGVAALPRSTGAGIPDARATWTIPFGSSRRGSEIPDPLPRSAPCTNCMPGQPAYPPSVPHRPAPMPSPRTSYSPRVLPLHDPSAGEHVCCVDLALWAGPGAAEHVPDGVQAQTTCGLAFQLLQVPVKPRGARRVVGPL